jgi:hypothetical protein
MRQPPRHVTRVIQQQPGRSRSRPAQGWTTADAPAETPRHAAVVGGGPAVVQNARRGDYELGRRTSHRRSGSRSRPPSSPGNLNRRQSWWTASGDGNGSGPSLHARPAAVLGHRAPRRELPGSGWRSAASSCRWRPAGSVGRVADGRSTRASARRRPGRATLRGQRVGEGALRLGRGFLDADQPGQALVGDQLSNRRGQKRGCPAHGPPKAPLLDTSLLARSEYSGTWR